MELTQGGLQLRILILLWMLGGALGDGANYSVVQFPSEIMVIKGDNITLRCSFSITATQPSSTKGAMSWFKGPRGTESMIEPGPRISLSYPDTFLSPGEGFLVITNVSLEDAGTYTCQVMVWGKGELCGEGTQLSVYARPSLPIIALQLQTEPALKWTLVCRTGGFYPAAVGLMWYHSGVKLSSFQQDCLDSTGYLEASSLLVLPDPDKETSFTCTVEHLSLSEPLSVQYNYEPQLQTHVPPSVIKILNLLKIGVIFAISIGFLITGCIKCCK